MNELEQKMNSDLIKKKKILNISLIIAVISFVLFLNMFFSYLKTKNLLAVIVTFVIFVTSIFFQMYYKNKLMKSIKDFIIKDIVPQIFDNKKVVHVPNGISKKVFGDSKMYTGYNHYYSSDCIKCIDNEFFMANVTAIEKSENSKKNIFLGIFGCMKTAEFYSDPIIIKPDVENKYVSNVINSKNKMVGTTENIVRLENNEFEKYFEVYSKNQQKARELITVEYMEKLLKLKLELNTLIKIIYIGNQKYVAIWNRRIIDEKSIYKRGIRIDEIKENLEKIFQILKEC